MVLIVTVLLMTKGGRYIMKNDESMRLSDGEELGAVGDISNDIIGHPKVTHEPVPVESLPSTTFDLPLVDMPRVQLI